MTKLHDACMLVSLNVSQWTARKFDKRVTDDVARQHRAKSNAGRYNKSLLPADEHLAKVHSITASIRSELYYKQTLPWGIEGSRLLPNAIMLDFSREFHQRKAEWSKAVDDFVQAYPQLKLQAQKDLPGGLYNEHDYPHVSAIKRKFRMEITVFPVPSDDFRCKFNADDMEELKAGVEAHCKRATEIAMRDVWERLFEKVKIIAEKLDNPDTVFRDSLIENAQEICSVLPRLNITDDPNLENMRKEVLAGLTRLSPEILRANTTARRRTADRANEIMRKMRGFMGDAETI